MSNSVAFSKLVDDEGNRDTLRHRADVQHSDLAVFPVRVTSLVQSPYRLATICLASLCAILLISIIAVSAHYKNRSQRGDEGTTLMQTDVSALTALISKLQQENKQLQEEKRALLAKLDLKLTTKAPPVVSLMPSMTGVPVECPTNWHLFNSSCYFISTQMKPWRDSQTYCQRQGAHLAIIHTAEEQTFLWDLLPRAHWNAYWFGISDRQKEDEWKWVDGTSVEKSFWEEGEPNNHINEDCGYIVKTQVLERVAIRSWYDAPCEMSIKFICEKEMKTQ
ncbi:hepatic lectin [Oryzias latipes]|uniref:C-type lectin domain-containing protein n=1 Tax=Oryzias latipes TaxID=8090 RepID=H2LPT2_ORYLA|nr:hepatic lectin [Oryzias latipes]